MPIENSAPIRVLIVHRYRSVLWGLERLVESAKSSMHVVGAVTTLAEALACLETAQPDVILLAHIDDELGLDAIPRIAQRPRIQRAPVNPCTPYAMAIQAG